MVGRSRKKEGRKLEVVGFEKEEEDARLRDALGRRQIYLEWIFLEAARGRKLRFPLSRTSKSTSCSRQKEQQDEKELGSTRVERNAIWTKVALNVHLLLFVTSSRMVSDTYASEGL